MKLSDLNYKEEINVPSIDQADATKLIDTEIKLIGYKTQFIVAFGDAEIRLRGEDLIIMNNERFDNWKHDCLIRKNKAMQTFNN